MREPRVRHLPPSVVRGSQRAHIGSERSPFRDNFRSAMLPPARLVIHVATGGAIFGVITLGALGVHKVVHWAQEAQLNFYVITSLEVFEVLIFALDIICAAAFALKETWIFLRSLARTEK